MDRDSCVPTWYDPSNRKKIIKLDDLMVVPGTEPTEIIEEAAPIVTAPLVD